jgi:filamentous hemagglutinin family protein
MTHIPRFVLRPVTALVLTAFCVVVQAQPTGGVVASGLATIGGTPAQMTITQTTPNAAIHWQSFGIRAGESVQFVQPSSTSVALNRVMGTDPSQILGQLSANGQVFLINPNGILFGPQASVNVGGLVASTVNLSEADLVSGHYAFTQAGTGTVVNQGLIRVADGGTVALLGSSVNNTGVVQAHSVENRNGTIVLLGHMDTGTVSVSGTLDVSGGANQTGGRVVATAHHVGLFNAHINASGDVGGGVVLIGGDEQGRNPAVPNASAVYMGADSAIHADANRQGDGGRVVLWANESTRAYGQVSARGGAQGGDGGLVETSGHALDVKGLLVDTFAVNGRTGTWLLDPADVTISSAVTTDATATGGVYAPNSGVSDANVNVADLATALGGTNVTVTTTNTGVSGGGTGDIHVNAALTWTAPTTLTLTAARDVNVNQAITGTDGSLVSNAGRDVVVGAAITTTTGNLSFNAVQDVKLNAATTITTGNLSAVAGRHVSVSAPATVSTGDMVFRADNDGTGPGVSAGTVNITCGLSCLTVTTGELNLRFNPASYGSTGSEILAYAGHLTGGGTLNAKAWVFGLGDDKLYDGTTTATVSGLKPDVTSVAPPVALGTVSNANFDTKHVGTAKPITFESSFADSVYALFATSGAPVGTYQARANVLVRPLSVSATSDTRVYNGTTSSTPIPTATGLQAGDSLNGTLTQSFASKDVLGTGNSTLLANGAYTVSDGNGGNNYSVSVVTAPGTITPAALLVTPNDVSKVYGQAPALTGFTTSSLVNGETVGGVTQTSAGQSAAANVAGSPYAITASNATGGTFVPSNYSITYVNGVLTVMPAALLVTPNDVSKVYGQAPALTGFTTSSLVNGETVGSVTQTSAGQSAAANVAGSPYAITASNATGGTFVPSNYSITYVNGVLTVTPAAVVPPVVVPEVVPPVVVVPEVVVPEVVPEVVEPPVVVPEVVPPVVAPEVVVPEVVPEVAEPPVVVPEAVPPGVSESQAIPRVPVKDPSAALLVVAPHPRMPSGLLVLQVVKPVAPVRVLPVRPPKQDRN